MKAFSMLRYPTAILAMLTVGMGTLNSVAQTDITSPVSTSIPQTSNDQADDSQLGSLMRVPDSAGLYMSTMNHQAVLESIFESNAYQSIKRSDVAKGMKKAYRRGRTRGYEAYNEDNPFAQYLKGYGDSIDNVIFQSVWQIAKQVVDHELFLYVDNDMLPVISSVQTTQAKMIEMFGFDDDFDFDELSSEQTNELTQLIKESIDAVDCPTMMIGSRLENPQGFRGMLELARSAAEQGMRNLPEELDVLRDFWKVVEEEDNFLLTVDMDLSKLPWDEILKEADNLQLASVLRNTVSKKRATVALGIIDNLLVVGIAKDRARLTAFGDGAKLIDLDSLKPLRKAIDGNQQLVSIFYMSQQYANASYSMENVLDQLKPLVRPILNEIDDIPADQKDELAGRIESEAQEFIADFSKLIPPRAMTFAFSTLKSDGLHGYVRAAVKHPMVDGSKPLNLATHASPNTIAFFNQRMYRLTDQYDIAAKWSTRLYSYARDFGMDQLEKELGENETNNDSAIAQTKRKVAKAVADAQAKVQQRIQQDSLDDFNRELADDAATEHQARAESSDERELKTDVDDELESDKEPDFETIKSFVAELEGLAKRFDTVTRKKLLPTIDGQEAGLFVQAVSGPNQWHPDMPASAEPLPLPFPAIVMGTTNAAATMDAGSEYWTLLSDMVASAKKHFPDEDFDEITLVPPNRTEVDGDVSFRWNWLSDYGEVDSSVQTGGLVTEDWVVLNLHPNQATTLTVPQSDRRLFGPAATDKPSIGLAFYDHCTVMNSLRKWISYAETQIPADEKPFDLAARFPAERDTLQFSEPQLRDAFERVWAFGKCMKGISIRSYEEADDTVTEYLLKFEDIAVE